MAVVHPNKHAFTAKAVWADLKRNFQILSALFMAESMTRSVRTFNCKGNNIVVLGGSMRIKNKLTRLKNRLNKTTSQFTAHIFERLQAGEF